MIRSLKSISRRAVVGGLMATALPVLAGPLPGGHRPSPSGPEALRRARTLVAAAIPSPDGAARVGRHYLRMVPAEQSMDTLVALVLQRIPDPDRLIKAAPLDRIRGEIQQSIRDDFACGRVSQVQGWMLSHTEARLAALAALV